MEQNIKKLFHQATYKPKSDLSDNVWHFLTMREKRVARLKLWAFSLVGGTSFVAFVPAIKMVLSDLTQSGFYEYVSLGLSNGGSILSFWKEFALLLADALPIVSIIVSLSLVFIFFLSLRGAMKEVTRGQLSPSF